MEANNAQWASSGRMGGWQTYIISVHIVKAIVSIVASKHDQHARRHRTTMGPTLAWRFAIGREFVPTICFCKRKWENETVVRTWVEGISRIKTYD